MTRSPQLWRMLPLGGLAVVLAGLGFALPGLATELVPGADADANRALLEQWRADPEQWARFHRHLELFRSLSTERRERLRQLDRELHARPPAVQARLFDVLERYVAWVERLPEHHRVQIDRSGSMLDRIRLVQDVLDEQWRNRLPRGVLEELVQRPASEQKSKLSAWRREERWLADQQRFLERTSSDLPATLPLLPNEFRELIEVFFQGPIAVTLTEDERERLRFAGRLCRSEQHQDWLFLLHTAAEVAAAHPLPKLPGPARGAAYRDRMIEFHREIARKSLPQPQRRQLPRSGPNSSWPDHALELTAWAKKFDFPLPSQLGPSTPDELIRDSGLDPLLRKDLRAFLEDRLPRVLSPDETKELEMSKKHWPDYPETLARLARQHNLTIPGFSLPGPSEFWEKFLMPSADSSGLPDPPERVLRAFLLRERARQDSGLADATLADPAGRTRVKQAYFRQYPQELARLRSAEPARP